VSLHIPYREIHFTVTMSYNRFVQNRFVTISMPYTRFFKNILLRNQPENSFSVFPISLVIKLLCRLFLQLMQIIFTLVAVIE
jgi:hypothetical protein